MLALFIPTPIKRRTHIAGGFEAKKLVSGIKDKIGANITEK
jgi:hypothetical protein